MEVSTLKPSEGKDYYANSASIPGDPLSGYDVSFGYDSGTNGKGRRTSMTDGSGSTSWTYDARGRVMTENKTISGQSFLTQWTYNSADLPVTMTYPDSEVVTISYNNRMLPTSVIGTDTYAQSIAYDSASRMIEVIRGANKIDTDSNPTLPSPNTSYLERVKQCQPILGVTDGGSLVMIKMQTLPLPLPGWKNTSREGKFQVRNRRSVFRWVFFT